MSIAQTPSAVLCPNCFCMLHSGVYRSLRGVDKCGQIPRALVAEFECTHAWNSQNLWQHDRD
eukprot:COSAG02_NODE_2324_length_9133_cov_38.463361_12_plen_62_part_00